MDNKEQVFSKYSNQIHFLGRSGLAIGLVILFAVPLLFGMVLDAGVDMGGFWKAFVQVAPLYIPSCIVEFLIYAPILGAGGSYLAFITGNLSNLKIPCAVNARDICDTTVGTPENEIISTLSIATSSLVNVAVLAIGVLCLVPLTPVLENPVLRPAFNNVIPALFGAMAFKYYTKSLKITVVPLVFMCLLCILVPSMITNVSLLIIPSGGIAIGIAWLLFKKDKLGNL
ncbi:MAG: hypothetical protein RSC01_04560 [Oscillospiraceae bacterium]